MKIIKLESSSNEIFNKICDWNYNWWGKRNNNSMEQVRCYFEHSLCKNRVPQTFVALEDNEPIGMYQFTMSDDLDTRPDIYPWLVNVYVDERYRGRGVCRELMNTVRENARKLELDELYLYTKHIGLYEKYGWKFVEEVQTFRDDSPVERLYKLQINKCEK